jgi:hypothetical protein
VVKYVTFNLAVVKPYLSRISMAQYPTRGSSLSSWVIWKMHSEEHRVEINWLVQEEL